MLKYLLNPHYLEPSQGALLKDKIKFLLQSYLYCVVFLILSSILIKLVDSCLVNFFHLPSIYENMIKNQSNFKDRLGQYAFIVMVLVAPFIEELIFRLPLDIKKQSIGIAIAIVVFRLSGRLSELDFYNYRDWLRIFVALFGIPLLVKRYCPDQFLNYLRDTKFKSVFYTSAILFGLIHIGNFATDDYRVWIFYPIYVLPQFFREIGRAHV